MDRRKALRSMGLAMGYTVATPTLISLMQSCKGEPVLEWTPDFFTKEEGAVLTKLVDIILPKTDTPSASEVQTNIFIDRFSNEVMEKEQQDFLKMTMGRFMDKSMKDGGKEKATDLTAEDLEKTLAEALKVTKEDQVKMFETINSYNEAIAKGETPNLEDNIAQFAFANNLRGMTIWGYKTSEYVGEEVLAYLPVPGEYIACGDLQELTEGKAWSL
ncbi:gluconate 2-dehydrogenase subunit 3 family protein [Aggregatimonas sangjinii]|uniref:Gluconate 2-dehydrogenase subunit 3 family protein n=1 Tax=Aggregatimonas sangjinii TaxID=2583587 RepID=A0A5B7SX56_9FLAO|nr:gluconate 2-dehydrogenase subunit 3 family protein [Aggregatimonas sangjinii]QCX01608.1 gluconate 2-dehydrogenase subunit 3 family protein [Aggregatimonas sangjinii]